MIPVPASATALVLALGMLVGGCDVPVRVGVEQARAGGINVERPSYPGVAGATRFDPPAASRAPRQSADDDAMKVAAAAPVLPPSLSQAHADGEVAFVRIDGSGNGQAVSFAIAFSQGQVSQGSGLAARVNGHEVPVQVDVQTRYPDASIRLATLSLPAGSGGNVTLLRHPAD